MSDKIKFYCNCGKKLNSPVEFAGKKAKCAGCGATLIIPHPGTQKPGIGISPLVAKKRTPPPQTDVP